MTTDTTDYEKLRDVYDWLVQSNKSLNAEIVKQALITFDRQAETIARLHANEKMWMEKSGHWHNEAMNLQADVMKLQQQLRAAEARAVPDEREAFEKWARDKGYQYDELARCTTGIVSPEYYNLNTEAAWQAWLSRALLAQQKEADQ